MFGLQTILFFWYIKTDCTIFTGTFPVIRQLDMFRYPRVKVAGKLASIANATAQHIIWWWFCVKPSNFLLHEKNRHLLFISALVGLHPDIIGLHFYFGNLACYSHFKYYVQVTGKRCYPGSNLCCFIGRRFPLIGCTLLNGCLFFFL